MPIKALIFDMDGTILYTLQDLADSVNFALEKCGLKQRTLDEIRNFVGNGVNKLIERATGNKKDKIEKCFQYFIEHYKKNSTNKTVPYENAVEILEKLKEKGLKLAVLSNKPDEEVKKLSEKYFNGIFQIAKGESPQFPKKPNPAALNEIIKTFNVKKEECLFIGDSEVDIQTAKNAEVDCISVTWGYKTKEFLIKNNAKKLFDNFQELFEYVDIKA